MAVLHRGFLKFFRRLTTFGETTYHFGLLKFCLALITLMAMLTAGSLSAHAVKSVSAGYPKLIEWMLAETTDDPLMAVSDLEIGFSTKAHQSNLEYFQNNPELIHSIKSQLDTTELSWELVENRRRLLAVPEQRAHYAALFEAYCREVIDYVTVTTGLQNPYGSIFTLAGDIVPDLSSESGITALLVHNLAEESIYTYAFQGGGAESVAVQLNQTQFTGELGSYTSHLIAREDGSLEFVPSQLTIWQNSAANPYSVLMVPVEETLHIVLRSATEQAIRADLDNPKKSEADPVGVVEEWVAVEEAMAGGLVNELLPGYLEQHVNGFQMVWIEDDLSLKQQMNRYRYLEKGIQVVKQLGVSKSLILYQDDPNEFRSLMHLDPDQPR